VLPDCPSSDLDPPLKMFDFHKSLFAFALAGSVGSLPLQTSHLVHIGLFFTFDTFILIFPEGMTKQVFYSLGKIYFAPIKKISKRPDHTKKLNFSLN
jgi:hypothetical protein